MVGSTTLTIRLDLETKRQLEKLATVLDVNLSDLLRHYVIPLAKISATLETIKMTKDLEKAVLKAIVGSKEFQNLLSEAKKYLVEKTFCFGHDCEYEHIYETILDSFLTIVEKEGLLWPARLERYFDNGSIPYEYWEVEEIRSLKDLVEWLQDLDDTFSAYLHDKIEKVKKAIKWFFS